MLEKIRRIKASMIKESSSDALCSQCQVAPCECGKGNHIEEAFIAPALSSANANAEHKRQSNSSNSIKVGVHHVGGESNFKSIKKHLNSKGIKAEVGTSDGYKTVHLSNMSHHPSEVKKKLGIKESHHIDESAQQLDELSKETLASYKHKAELSIPKDDREYANRSKGISKAEKKMKKESAHPFDEFTTEELEQFMQTEDYQQLDELSKKTLGSYVKKAAIQLPQHQTNSTLKHTGPIDRAHSGKHPKTGESPVQWDDRKVRNRQRGIINAADKLTKEAAQYPRATHTDVKDAAAPRAPAEKDHASMHKVTVHNGIPAKHEDGADKVKGAAKAQPKPKKNYVEDPQINKEIYLQSFKAHVQMKGDLERM